MVVKRSLTYKDAGVDIEQGERFVKTVKRYAKKTYRNGVISDIGGFGAFFQARFRGYSNPILVSSTDGVGTKLKVAVMANKHDAIGIDLVAMSVNDIITSGAEPLFFLDYFAMGRLEGKRATQVIKGIANGCKAANCALIGGETAEMPGIYRSDEYDLAGFAVGVVDKVKIIDGSTIKPGDTIIGLASNGLHSNGYSLARKVFFDKHGFDVNTRIKGLKRNIGSELLRPTRIYVNPVLNVTRRYKIKGIAHITGGGFLENIPRILPSGCKVAIKKETWPIQPIFRLIQQLGSIAEDEMYRTFNCGIGLVMIADHSDSMGIFKTLKSLNEKPYFVGEIVKKGRGEKAIEIQ